jgi:hypothetical protein
VRTFVTVPEVRLERVTVDVATRELSVVLFETTRALVVSVPVV